MNMPSEVALRAADIVGGILAGRESGGVSTDALRAASSAILENPVRPDPEALTRVLFQPRLDPAASHRDLMTPAGFYAAVAREADADILARANIVFSSFVEQVVRGEVIARQDLVKYANVEGALFEVGGGAVSVHKRLTRALPDEGLGFEAELAVGSIEAVRKLCVGLSPMFHEGEGNVIARGAFLSQTPRVNWNLKGRIDFVPTWTAFAFGHERCFVGYIDATTAELAFSMTLPTAFVLGANPIIFAASWGGFFAGLAKVIEICLLAVLIVPVGSAGLGSAWTILGPILAAIGIMIILCAMIKKFIDLLKEIMGETDQDKLQALLARLERLLAQLLDLQRRVASGQVTQEQANKEANEKLNEARDLVKQAKELAGGDETAESALDALQNAVEAAAEALSTP